MKKYIIKNKKVYYNYIIKKKFTAGILLKGWEVKSIKKKNINIENSYVKIEKNNNIYIIGFKIKPLINNINIFKKKNRKIKILLKKKEINYLYKKNKIKGFTIIVISLILKKPWYKIIIGLSKGKKKYNKKNFILNKEWKKKKNINKNIDLY